MKPLLACLILSSAAISFAIAPDEDLLKALSSSEVWQVRSCVSREFKWPTASAKANLERLCADENSGVAGQALMIYTSLFVQVDRKLMRRQLHFLRPRGFHTDDGKQESVDSALAGLTPDIENPDNARAIERVGILGEAASAEHLRRFQKSSNSYVLIITALAL